MKNTLPIIAVILLLQVSCNKNKVENSSASSTKENISKNPEKFTVDSVKVDDSIKIDDNLTATFFSSVLVFPQIKDKVLLDSIYAREEIVTSDYSKENILEKLNAKKNQLFEETKASIKDYKPNFKQTWTENSQMKLFSHENDLLTLVYTGDGYSGGAHGYYYEFYDIFDLKNNKKIQLSEVVIDSKDTIWSKILMDNFLKNDLENGQAQMLLVKDIPLNDNFYFDKDNLYFLYNQYEIAAYAAGPVLIKIPFSTVKPLMKPEMKTRLGLE